MPLPNFFVIGAPKSGTTALYDCLKQHPEIYMSPVKEPHFFAFDGQPPVCVGPAGSFFRQNVVWRPLDYFALFAGVTNQRVVGEASAGYLRSPLAAQRIKQYVPDSKLVVVLRQPADRAYSDYVYRIQRDEETAGSFPEALAHEDARRTKGWADKFFYAQNGCYLTQLSAYYNLFRREQIRVYLYEDWKESPQAMLRDLFGFLQVDESFSPEVRRSNVSLIPKNHLLHTLYMRATSFVRTRLSFLPGAARGTAVAILQGMNNRCNLVAPPAIDPEIRHQLTDWYREEIVSLQDLIGRDLSHWLKTPAPSTQHVVSNQ